MPIADKIKHALHLDKEKSAATGSGRTTATGVFIDRLCNFLLWVELPA